MKLQGIDVKIFLGKSGFLKRVRGNRFYLK
jgi:hypothetical protein